MASQRFSFRSILLLLATIVIVLIALPQSFKQWAPSSIRDADVHYGLDLAGGTQLDFRISEQEMFDQLNEIEEQIRLARSQGAGAERIAVLEQQKASTQQQQATIVEAIRTVLERRINALGVSEAIITPSYIGGEKHLLVECPGVVNVQECIDTVGKTIKLEFKEELTEATTEFEAGVRTRANEAMRRITGSGETLEVIGQDLGSELGMAYIPEAQFFRDQLPKGLESLWDKPAGPATYKMEGALTTTRANPQTGAPEEQQVPGVLIAQVVKARTGTGRTLQDAPSAFTLLAGQAPGRSYQTYKERALDDPAIPMEVKNELEKMKQGELRTVALVDGSARILFNRLTQLGGEQMAASHILIAYQGATNAEPTVTRTKDEALALARDVRARLDKGETFDALARSLSDGPSKDQAGSLGTFTRQQMVPAFADAAFKLQKGQLTDPVETAFGYHIIRADASPTQEPSRITYDELVLTGTSASADAEALLAQLQTGNVKKQEDALTLRVLFFSLEPTGWKDTALDGKHFRAASVTLDPTTNIPVVQISFDEEGGRMFQELTKRNIGKRIAIFVGGQLVSAPTVQTEISGGTAVITGSGNFSEAKLLAQDLNTGAIPAPIYLSGQRRVEATLGAEALQLSLYAAFIGTIVLMLFLIIVYRLLGVLASGALLIYTLLFYVLLKLPLLLVTSNYIVLTLAGIAGIILSMGMAVDANVLIFERMKEEMRKGKNLGTATEIGFKRAWPSIRDGNVSTLITCAILFTVGTSIVRGFAVTLTIGIVLSLFSALVVTRWLVDVISKTKLANKPYLFAGRVPKSPQQ